jgi:multicomponent Na+:H+ antiporter subunit E
MIGVALQSMLHRALLLGAVWVVLVAGEPKGLLIGAAAVPAALWTSLRLLPADRPWRLWRLVGHVPRFLAGSLRGAIDVAWRAVSPRMPLAPGWIDVPLDLPDGGRAVMGGELSLMPGTLAAGSRGGRLLVHVLDTRAGFERAIPETAAAIAAMIGDTSGDRGRRE